MNEKPKKLTFRQFLNESTNLITIFGIFNALLIYSASINYKHVTDFLIPSFLLLSLIVWFELILFAIESNNGSKKYELFYVLICAIELGLIIYFFIEFRELVSVFISIIILLSLTWIFIKFYSGVFKKRILKLKEKNIKIFSHLITFIAFLTSLIIMIFIMLFIRKILGPLFEDILSEFSKTI